MTPTAAQPHAGVDAVRASTPAASAAAANATIGARAEARTATAAAGAATILAAFTLFLAGLRELHRAWLVKQLATRGPEGDVQLTLAGEMAREHAFAQASAERLARALPAALAIADPAEREAKVRSLLEAEKRYAQQRADAMAERAFAAMERMSVRRVSPEGAYWQLGIAHQHTEGCLQMGGKPWPWVVLDRVHPPRHPGCVSSLRTIDEAVARGLMRREDMPDDRTAIRQSANVMMEGDAAALERELDLRDRLVEAGAVGLGAIEFVGVSEAFDPSQPRDFRGRWIVSGSAFGERVADALEKRWPDFYGSAYDRRQGIARHEATRQHQDHEALQALEDAEQRNADDGAEHLYPTFGHPPVLLEASIDGSLARAEETHLRVSAKAMRANHYLDGTRPAATPGEFTTAADIGGILRHEWFHHAERLLSIEERSAYLTHVPKTKDGTFDWDRVAAELSWNAAANPAELAAELYALGADPKWKAGEWQEWVQSAAFAAVESLYMKAGIE